LFSLGFMRDFRCVVVLVAIVVGEVAQSAASDWENQPGPSFPTSALERNVAGVVKLRLIITKSGTVDHVVLVKSSGDRVLDEAAERGVLLWRMNRDAIRPGDFVSGREVLLDFKEEAAVAARYPNGVVAGFSRVTDADIWRSAPFPAYPMDARLRHEQGIVRLKVVIGKNGNVAQIGVFQSSGHKALDDAAVRAVQLWRAHPRYAGRTFAVPIDFTLVPGR
jgi:TonB family protein